MIRPEFRRQLVDQQKVLLLVWVGFIGATALYLWIPQSLLERLQPPGDYPLVGTVRYLLWLVALLELTFLFWWKRSFLTKEAILRKYGESKWVPRLIKGAQSESEENAGRGISYYLAVKIVAFAIAESLAIYGLFLAYSGRYFHDQYFLSFICALLLLYFYPSRSFMTELMREFDPLEGQ